MQSNVFGFTLLSIIAITVGAPAQAQNGSLSRSFVSSAGVDSNPCTITQPCATFAQAYAKVGANGIVAALDPGKYGPVNITSPVTINGNGWAAITGLASSYAINVNIQTGTGNVILTGLEIDGAGSAANGIFFTSGGSLTVVDSAIRNFTNDGILMPNPAGNETVSILNTIASNNTHDGIEIQGIGLISGTFQHSTTESNGHNGVTASGASINIVGSTSNNNGNDGFYVSEDFAPQPYFNTARDCTASGNGNAGFHAENKGYIWFAHSTTTLNHYGVYINGQSVIYSFGDNHVGGNATDMGGSIVSFDTSHHLQ
jgi:hypothetical protein